jgi:hypothetical protein
LVSTTKRERPLKKHLLFLRTVSAVFLAIFLLGDFAIAAPGSFKRQDVSNARFGEGDREKYLRNAHQLATAIQQDVKGQGTAAQILQNRVVQYFENFGTRTGEPGIFQERCRICFS